jgi:TP901 family phage tail tape measure protein
MAKADFNILLGVKTSLQQAMSEMSAVAGKGQQMFAKLGQGMSNAITSGVVGTFAGLALAIAGSGAAAVKFQNDFANVKKTMSDVDDPQVFAKIQEDLVKLSTQIPIFASELAGIASVGGQLGIGADDISKFTEVVAKLGGATNMTSEQAATGMARFLNVTNQTTDAIGMNAAVLVELGNNTAATESEILLLAQNFGAAGNIAGLSADEILAFSAAMRETGQQSQAGATALGKLFMGLSDAAKVGGKEMSTFAEVAGMDINAFRRSVEMDIGGAAQQFLTGLNQMIASGSSTTSVLEDLGLGTIRVQRAILSLANNQEGLTEAMSLANAQTITQNALNDEAEEKFSTVAMQTQQLKSTMGAAAITMGQAVLPIMEVLVKVANVLAQSLLGLAEFFKDFPGVLFGVTGVLGVLSALLLKNAANVKGLGVVVKALGGIFSKTAGMVGLAVTALALIGRAYMKFKADMENVEEISNAVDSAFESLRINITEGFEAEPIKQETWEAFLTNLPEATREAVLKGVEQGFMGKETFDAITKFAPQVSDQFKQDFKGLLDIDEGFFTGDSSAVSKRGQVDRMLEEIDASGQSKALGGTVALLKEYRALQGKIGGDHRDRREEIEQILSVQYEMFDAVQNEYRLRDIGISQALNEHFENVSKIDRRTASLMRTEAGRLKLARELANGPDGIKKFKDILGDTVNEAEDLNEEIEDTVSNLDILLRIVNDFNDSIDNLFSPTKAQFEAQRNERDLNDAHKEHADLHVEQKELTQEELDLAQEKLDLANADLRTAEEKLEMQELENEALEIEKQIREGMALSANDQLRKEKLKKDLARVNAAAAQGSLEFADLEKKAIEEQIAEIDGKALTQADADKKRAKAAEIAQTAEERRLDRLTEIDSRRLEIQERLAEIPGEILEAHYNIHNLQVESVKSQLAMLEAQVKYNSVKEYELKMTAELLGLDMKRIDGLMTLMNHARVESGPLGQSLMDFALPNIPAIMGLQGMTPTNSTSYGMGQGVYDEFVSAGSKFANIKPTYKHIGGAFKGGRNYVVGEYGPEMLKAFPGGGGMITPMGKGSGGDTTNYVTLNVTGLPSDPISARRTAQLIQKELNKLKSDGRSGVVR